VSASKRTSIEGKVGHLLGLKENVIIGKLIPAATGLKRYRTIEIKPSGAMRCSPRSRRSGRTATRRLRSAISATSPEETAKAAALRPRRRKCPKSTHRSTRAS
jgi:hypothetical protein